MDGKHLLAEQNQCHLPDSIPELYAHLTDDDIEVTGYGNRTNKLHLFDVETVDESLVENGISFDKTDISKNLTLFLYPDDSDRAGQILRIYQQYFMVSNAARLILSEAAAKGSTFTTCQTMRSSKSTTPIPPCHSRADSSSHHRARHGNG